MKITGKITNCSAKEDGISIKIDINGLNDRDKGDAEQLLKWAIHSILLKFNISEDNAQQKIEAEV